MTNTKTSENTFNRCKKCGTKLGTTRVVQTTKHTERIKICPSCRADIMFTYEIHADRFKFLEACETDRTTAIAQKLQEDYAQTKAADEKEAALSQSYTRIDAGTGREHPLSDSDWPDNGSPTLPAQVTEASADQGDNAASYDLSDVLTYNPKWDTSRPEYDHEYALAASAERLKVLEAEHKQNEAERRRRELDEFKQMLAENEALRNRQED